VRTETIKTKWNKAFASAVINAPSIVIFDDIDVLMPAEREVCLNSFNEFQDIRIELHSLIGDASGSEELAIGGAL